MSTNTVFINPVVLGPDRADGGIRRVVEAQCKYLPEFGWEISPTPDGADLIFNHGTMKEERPGVPMIAGCHGLYWSDYKWPTWYEEANLRVIDVMTRAQAVTAPSHWVKGAIARGTLINPTVIYHGIEKDEWSPPPHGEHFGYGLWNKARTDPVSNHLDVEKIAAMLPGIPFVSTFGQESVNLKVIGALSYQDLKPWVQRAGFYLATVRETFGISVLEAMACGVPIVGWDFGGQREIITNGYEGILVPYGDYQALAEAILHVINDRERYSKAAFDAVQNGNWDWRPKIGRYANLFDRVLARHRHKVPRVSVIVTCYNLGRYLDSCLGSVLEQTMKDWECIVVDDASEDETPAVMRRFQEVGVKYHRCPENVGLSMARNIGWQLSSGKYIIFLDADDMLDRAALERLADALDRDTSIHIASGGLDTVDEHGSARKRNDWPPESFDWGGQAAHLNQLPYASLMRRSVLETSGGYRSRDWRAEDAALWLRVTSLGFRAARVTQEPVLIYRLRSNSKGGKEREKYPDRDGDWTYWFPWRVGASSGEQGLAMEGRYRFNPQVVPFGAQGKPPKPAKSWPVHHHAEPVVSVIIPVGPGHDKYLVDALDSVMAQTCPFWEAVVVDDRAETRPIDTAAIGHPHARVVEASWTPYFTGKGPQPSGAGKARNIGARVARGQFLLFLDADDMLRPTAIERMLTKYVEIGGGYIYSDCEAIDDFTKLGVEKGEILETVEFDQRLWLSSGYSKEMPGRHSVTFLTAKADFDNAGGFDPKMEFWEDWELPMRYAALGVRGARVAEPLLIYRFSTGNRRRAAFDQEGRLMAVLKEMYEPYITGEKEMCNCGGGLGSSLAQAKAMQALSDMQANLQPEDMERMGIDPLKVDLAAASKIRLKYLGERMGDVPYKGSVTRKIYRFSADPAWQYQDVEPADVPHLMKTGDFSIEEVYQ